jgi:feruloyl esterase
VVADQGGEAETQEFLRLFMVPGMGHCSGGPGPGTFDALAALEQWVEEGVAPEQMIGANMGSGITRPLCPYPQVAEYSGSGSTDDAENWSCVNPE